MKPKDLLVPIVGIVLILFVAVILPGIQQANEEADLRARIEALEERANAGPGEFLMPESPDLDPNVEYLNAFSAFDSTTYDVTIFDANRIIEEQTGLSEDALAVLSEDRGWVQTRYQSPSDMGGGIFQFERRK